MSPGGVSRVPVDTRLTAVRKAGIFAARRAAAALGGPLRGRWM